MTDQEDIKDFISMIKEIGGCLLERDDDQDKQGWLDDEFYESVYLKKKESESDSLLEPDRIRVRRISENIQSSNVKRKIKEFQELKETLSGSALLALFLHPEAGPTNDCYSNNLRAVIFGVNENDVSKMSYEEVRVLIREIVNKLTSPDTKIKKDLSGVWVNLIEKMLPDYPCWYKGLEFNIAKNGSNRLWKLAQSSGAVLEEKEILQICLDMLDKIEGEVWSAQLDEQCERFFHEARKIDSVWCEFQAFLEAQPDPMKYLEKALSLGYGKVCCEVLLKCCKPDKEELKKLCLKSVAEGQPTINHAIYNLNKGRWWTTILKYEEWQGSEELNTIRDRMVRCAIASRSMDLYLRACGEKGPKDSQEEALCIKAWGQKAWSVVSKNWLRNASSGPSVLKDTKSKMRL